MPGIRGLLVAGRYRLDVTIGQGGMGRVWRAFDEILDRQVAVKEMRMNDLDAEDSRIRRERTLREARATARIDHPNVVRVYDVVEESDRLWIVMELVDARSLEQLLVEDGPVPPREAARIGLGLVEALREVHAVGVLHRDIKPGNVLLVRTGRVVLTDFGIAAIQDATALTVVGMLVGSPDYMAPERVGGRPQGPASDLWSLGATLCAAVGGQSPFARETTLATLHAVLYEEPELPHTAGPLGPVLASLLVKNPDDRPTLDALSTLLMPIAAPPTVLARTPTLAVRAREAQPPEPQASEAAPVLPPPTRPPEPEPQPGPSQRPAWDAGPGAATPPPETPLPPLPPQPTPTPGGHAAEPQMSQREGAGWGTRRRLAITAAAAASITAATATALILTTTHGGTDTDTNTTPTPPTTTVAGTSRPPTTPPPGTRGETGFAWAPPKGWTRTAKSPSNIHYHAPGGKQEIAASYALVRGGDLMTQWQEAEQGSHDVPGYRNIRLERTTFNGRPAVVWDYYFTQDGDPWKARQTGFDEGGKSYQVNIWYLAATEDDALRTYSAVTSSFTPL
ncbi:serine/threonine-protein kinase [Streptomyces melanogenes]|uniref:non-specific serine/threonine protein kinase n=1 Tax=Streptomyces melanogenes TaxID=67326 RepID=A0ABZ1XIV1_9ACTN|nr:serine/threonine-protein kinase [Streptomyces melanogenes]